MGRARRVARGRRLPASATLWALTFVLLAVLLPPTTGGSESTGQGVELSTPPVVTDPLPPPGGVVPAGPSIIAARVEGAAPHEVTFTVDGAEATGLSADPDGALTALAGIEVTLEPGRRRIGVAVGDHGTVREWEVVAVGLDVQHATEDAPGLARRLVPDDAAEVVVLVDPGDHAAAVAAAPIATMLDGVALPTGRRVVPAGTWAALRRSADDTRPEVLLLGSTDRIQVSVEQSLRTAGFHTIRIEGDTPAAVTRAGMAHVGAVRSGLPDAVIVAPAGQFHPALEAAIAAARLGTALVLVDDAAAPVEETPGDLAPDVTSDTAPTSPLDTETVDALAVHDTVLLSRALPDASRTAVVDALPPGAVASDDDLRPGAASEAVVVADSVGRDRALVASLAAASGRTVLLGTDAAARWVGTHRPDRVTLIDDLPTLPAPARLPAFAVLPALDADAPAVLPDDDAPTTVVALDPDVPAADEPPLAAGGVAAADLSPTLTRAWVDGPDPPVLSALVDVGSDSDQVRIALTAPEPVGDGQVHVTLLGYEWPGEVVVDGLDLVWTAHQRPRLPLPLEPATPDSPAAITMTVALTSGDRTVHDRFVATVPIHPLTTTSSEGFVVAGGRTGVTGTGGRLYTYSVEVEPATGLDVGEVEAEVTRILTDARSWTADGAVSFQRVGSSAARVRVVVATPATVDALCGAVGLRTGGRVSCWDGFRTMLNLDRWNHGVPHFRGDLVTYREYLVNHEVGHALGHGHVGCHRPGALAPVMMQQTGSVGACLPNGWPFPNSR